LPWNPSTELPAIIRKDEEVGYPWQLAKKYGGSQSGAPAISFNQTFQVTGHTGEELERRTQQAVRDATQNSMAITQQALTQFSSDILPSRMLEIHERSF